MYMYVTPSNGGCLLLQEKLDAVTEFLHVEKLDKPST